MTKSSSPSFININGNWKRISSIVRIRLSINPGVMKWLSYPVNKPSREAFKSASCLLLMALTACAEKLCVLKHACNFCERKTAFCSCCSHPHVRPHKDRLSETGLVLTYITVIHFIILGKKATTLYIEWSMNTGCVLWSGVLHCRVDLGAGRICSHPRN